MANNLNSLMRAPDMESATPLSNDAVEFLCEAISLIVETYGIDGISDANSTIETGAVFQGLKWPWDNAKAYGITNELISHGLIVIHTANMAVGRLYVTAKGL